MRVVTLSFIANLAASIYVGSVAGELDVAFLKALGAINAFAAGHYLSLMLHETGIWRIR